MSNYTKTTDFEAKDSLPTGDSGKIIRGAEFETEFDAISTAIATKADTAGPTFTGTLTFETISDGTIGVTAFVDEDDMSSDSATLVPTQQSVKAYVDAQVTAQDLDFQADSGGALSIDLDSETMTFTGGTGIDTSGSGNAVTFAIDSTVATLTGTQTLTNKTLTSPVLNTGVSGTAVLDEDDMSSNSATQLATQQSIKAYVDSQVGANNELSEILANGNTTGGTNIVFGDSASVSDDRLVFGAGSDLQIYHSGTHSYIDDAGTGNLTLRGNASVRVEKYEGEILADFAADGAVSLYHDNSVKIATTSTGVNVTGTVEFDGLSGTGSVNVTDILDQDDMSSNSATALATQQSIKAYVDSQVGANNELSEVLANGNTTGGTDIAVGTGDDITFADSSKAIFGAGSDLQIYHDGSNSRVQEAGTGSLLLRGTNLKLQDSDGYDYVACEDGGGEGGTIKLKHNNSTVLTTTSTGINVTGLVESDEALIAAGTGTDAIQTLRMGSGSGGANKASINFQNSAAGEIFSLDFNNSTGTFDVSGDIGGLALSVTRGGDISFYEDTGTTAKFFWDAADERLGLGTSSPSAKGHIAYTTAATANRTYGLVINGDDTGTTGESSSLFLGGLNTTARGASIAAEIQSASNDHDLIFSTSGASAYPTERMRIDSSGRVGIGTTPLRVLDIATTTGGTIIHLTDDATGHAATDGVDLQQEGTLFQILNREAGDIRFGTDNTERMRIDSSGNVGIGTSNPTTPLSISSNTPVISLIESDQSNKEYQIGSYGSAFAIYDGSNSQFRYIIDTNGNHIFNEGGVDADFRVESDNNTHALFVQGSNGNVGIGTSSPSARLTVGAGASSEEIKVDAGAGWADITLNSDSTNGGHIYFNDGSNAGEIFYYHVSDYMAFNTAGSERMRIDSDGNLGISTSSPATGTHSSYRNLVIGETTSATSGLSFKASTTGQSAIFFSDGASPFNRGQVLYDHSSDHLAFSSAGSEAMRIDSSQNLLVGTTNILPANNNVEGIALSTGSYGGRLEASRSGGAPCSFNRVDSDGSVIEIRRAGSTVGSIGSANTNGMYIGTGDNALFFDNSADAIRPFNTSTLATRDNAIDLGRSTDGFKDLYLSGTANVGGEVVLNDSGTAKFAIGNSTNDFYIYSNAAGSERLRIDSSGNLLVGTTASAPNGGEGVKIIPAYHGTNKSWTAISTAGYQTETTLSIYSTAVTAYRFYVDAAGTISAVNTTITSLSDERAKENIRDLDDGLAKVMQLQPRKFDWKKGQGKDISNDRGFIAQEFEQVFPDMIEEWKDEAPEGEEPYKAVNANLIPTLVKAIQEQNELINDLRARVAQLEGEN